ncbi:MAG TPA: DUF1638 domain-containing protein [Bryobacteraceae bacterium]|nr:DUF1638 domain-containing protein [Bryobacteraceae bacterium]
MRLKLIACEVLFREMCEACAHSPHQVDLDFMPKGLHDLGGKGMSVQIQEMVDRTPEGVYEAILLGYGLCGNGLHGLTARHTRLVLPRAHDCIALLMGDRERYQQYFDQNPGTFYRSTGWLERGQGLQQLTHETMGFEEPLETLILKYGEDNGRYLFGELTRYRSQYRKLAFIETGLEGGGKFFGEAFSEAKDKGWTFERLPGDLAWLRHLIDGQWDPAEFVIAEPGQRIVASYDSNVLKVES